MHHLLSLKNQQQLRLVVAATLHLLSLQKTLQRRLVVAVPQPLPKLRLQPLRVVAAIPRPPQPRRLLTKVARKQWCLHAAN